MSGTPEPPRGALVAARRLAGDHHPHGAVRQRHERRRAVIIRVRPQRTHVQYEEARTGQGPAGDGGAARAGRDHAERGASSIARVFGSHGRRVSASAPSRSKARRVRRRLEETRDEIGAALDRCREARTTSRQPAREVPDATTREHANIAVAPLAPLRGSARREDPRDRRRRTPLRGKSLFADSTAQSGFSRDERVDDGFAFSPPSTRAFLLSEILRRA